MKRKWSYIEHNEMLYAIVQLLIDADSTEIFIQIYASKVVAR